MGSDESQISAKEKKNIFLFIQLDISTFYSREHNWFVFLHKSVKSVRWPITKEKG